MRLPLYSDGGRHDPDYVAQTDATILVENIHLTYDISVSLESAGGAEIVPPSGIVACFAAWTIFAAIGFVLEVRFFPAQSDALVLQIRPDSPERSLMEPLVLHLPTVVSDPDAAHIADDELPDSCFVQSLYPRRRQLVLDVPNLVVQLPKLTLLGLDQSFTALTSFLLPVNPGGKFRLEFLAIATLGSEEPSIQNDMDILGSHDRRMDFTEINGREQSFGRQPIICYLIRRPQFVFSAIPAYLDLNRLRMGPAVDDDRICSSGVGQNELPILDLDCLIRPDDLEVAFVLSRRTKLRIYPTGLSPRLERRHEALDRLLGGLRVEGRWLPVGKNPLKSAFGKPYVLATDIAPEPDLCQRVYSAGFLGEFIESFGSSKLEFADQVHGLHALLVLDVFLYCFEADASDGRHEVAIRPERRKPGSEPCVPLAKIMAGSSFHSLHDAMNPELRVAFNKHMNVVRHDLHLDDLRACILCHRFEDRLERSIDGRLEHRPPILRTPDNVVSAQMHYIPSVIIPIHVVYLVYNMARNNQEARFIPMSKGRDFRVSIL